MSYNLTGAAYGGNLALSKAGLIPGTTVTYTTGAALTYTQKGEFKASFGAQTNQAVPALDAQTGKAFVPQAAGESCLYAFFMNSAGAVAVVQSKKASTLDFQGGLGSLEFPQMGDGYTPFGYFVAVASSALAAPWTFGASNWAGVTGMTVTSHDIMDYPAQPIIAA